MQKLIRSIPVRDAQGVELMLHECRTREYRRVLGPFGYWRKGHRLVLDTGEVADRLDGDTFILRDSGERLRRMR